jgi:hypothetical protein
MIQTAAGDTNVGSRPVRAHYSWSNTPMGIVWYGQSEPPGSGPAARPEKFFGGAALTPNDLFAQVNGYTTSKIASKRPVQ